MAEIIAHDLTIANAETDDYMLGIDTSGQSELVQMALTSVAKVIVENYKGSTINGSKQTIVSAFQNLLNKLDSQSYYKAGNTISGSIYVGGVVTNNKSDIKFTIPLSKPLKNGSNLTASKMDVVIRQNNAYHFGSGEATANALNKITSITFNNNNINVVLTNTWSNLNTLINNDVVGVYASYIFTVS